MRTTSPSTTTQVPWMLLLPGPLSYTSFSVLQNSQTEPLARRKSP